MLTLALSIPHFRKLLGEKKDDLTSNIKRLEGEGLTGGERDVRDSTDQATVSQEMSESLEEASLASRTLVEVPDPLLRIAHNAYGTCIACGKQSKQGVLKRRLGRLIALRTSRSWIRQFAKTTNEKIKGEENDIHSLRSLDRTLGSWNGYLIHHGRPSASVIGYCPDWNRS